MILMYKETILSNPTCRINPLLDEITFLSHVYTVRNETQQQTTRYYISPYLFGYQSQMHHALIYLAQKCTYESITQIISIETKNVNVFQSIETFHLDALHQANPKDCCNLLPTKARSKAQQIFVNSVCQRTADNQRSYQIESD